ncbi:MAG: acetoacetyl-CoA synthase [Alteromonadaceae bacterium]|nr:MAG: acetoacetyl-CoA synthase [Alteromonadaceae bacterium]
MQPTFDTNAPKKATNLSINSDLLAKSRALNINLSATLEKALKRELSKSEAEKWQRANKVAIKAYNNFVEENGCFGDEHRTF